MLKISVGGKIIEFEDHPICGPHVLNRNCSPLKHQPQGFLYAVSLWAQQGRRMEDSLCRWDHEPQPIIQFRGGRRFITDPGEPRRGE